MTDAVKEEFIKLVGDRPADLDGYVGRQAASEHVLLQNQWDSKLEGFRLARSNGVPAGEADRRDALELAYGLLWHVNAGMDAPVELEVKSLTPDQGARMARRALYSLLTHEQRGQGINAAQKAISDAAIEQQKETEK